MRVGLGQLGLGLRDLGRDRCLLGMRVERRDECLDGGARGVEGCAFSGGGLGPEAAAVAGAAPAATLASFGRPRTLSSEVAMPCPRSKEVRV